MLRLATWKVAAILALIACAALLIVPSFLSAGTVAELESHLPSFIPVRPIVLGLDLQGGAHMLMEVDSASVIKAQVEALRDDVRGKLREGKISISGGIAMQPRGVVVRIADPAERQRALGLLQSLNTPVGGAFSGATGHSLDVSDTGDGAIRRDLDRHGDQRKDSTRGEPVDRSAEPASQRLRHQGDQRSAAGRRSHPRRGARPAGYDQAEGSARRHRQTRRSSSSPTPGSRPTTSKRCRSSRAARCRWKSA